jgi:ABC-type Fe3+/spermidine/putrescine transport system ATPase subunit
MNSGTKVGTGADQVMEKPDPGIGGLRLENVKKRIGDFILAADFEIPPGARAVLIGRSGIGKTSLLRLIAGLDNLDDGQDSGRLWVGKKEITHLPPQQRETGLVFQDQALFPALSVLDNVTFGLRMRGSSREERESQALPWLEKVGLAAKLHSSVVSLSGGEAQRVAFVRALIWKPKVILLDEPFSALDPALRASLRRELLDLHQLWPVPLVLVSHDPEDFHQVSTLRLVMEEERPEEILPSRRIHEEYLPVRRIRVEY